MIRQTSLAGATFCIVLMTSAGPTEAAEALHPTAAQETAMDEALRAQGPEYRPRTRHLDDHGAPRFTNRLILESSPYLLQHAHNPVQWLPWGPEARQLARETGRPIFLSIGYATCHWCHVMERESFDDEAVAALLNRHFIPVKVDREEMPVVDAFFLTGLQLLTGEAGGWPMSNFTTAAGEPFFAGTYYPPEAFKRILQRIAGAWKADKSALEQQAAQLTQAIRQLQGGGEGARSADVLYAEALTAIMQRYDPTYGGLGQGEKFPAEAEMLLLTDAWMRGDAAAGKVVQHSLQAMAEGALRDPLGGGFHRYTVDRAWRVPHFEKMLYNQALLSELYLLAYQMSHDPAFRQIAEETLHFMTQRMRLPDGSLLAAIDAGEDDGAYYRWTLEELLKAVPAPLATLAREVFWPAGPGGDTRALINPPSRDASTPRRADELAQIRQHLLQRRAQRPAPLQDDKTLLAWNAMAVRSLAHASAILDQPERGRQAIGIWRSLDGFFSNDGRIRGRARRSGSYTGTAVLEDYAWSGLAALALYDLGEDPSHLRLATQLADAVLASLWDDADGGFFDAPATSDDAIPVRLKSLHDQAAGLSAHALALQWFDELFRRSGESRFQLRGQAMTAAYAGRADRQPAAHPSLLRALRISKDSRIAPIAHAARGRVRLHLRRAGGQDIALTTRVEPGWHVKAWTEDGAKHQFELRGEALSEPRYPPAQLKQIASVDGPLRVYEGEFEVTARSARPATMQVHLQACSDALCLAPESVRLLPPGP